MDKGNSEMLLGEATYHAAKILTATRKEATGLSQLACRQMKEHFPSIGLRITGNSWDATDSYRATSAAWFHIPVSLAEKSTMANSSDGTITLVFDFATENSMSERIKQSILFVCWTPRGYVRDISWSIGSFEGKELSKLVQDKDDLLAGYETAISDQLKQDWVYAIPLSALSTAGTADAFVVAPVLALLAERPAHEALGPIREKLIRFPAAGP